MKKVNLNIDISDLKIDLKDKGKKGWEIAKKIVEDSFIIYQQQPQGGSMGKQSIGLLVKDHRKIIKILDALELMKEGILELEDDWYNFLREIFNKVRWIGATKVIVRIADRIEDADKDKNANKEKQEPSE